MTATMTQVTMAELEQGLVQLGVDTTAVNQARYSCTSW